MLVIETEKELDDRIMKRKKKPSTKQMTIDEIDNIVDNDRISIDIDGFY